MTTEGDRVGALLDRMRQRAPAWYPDLDSERMRVLLRRRHGRRNTVIVIVELADGVLSELVVAKMALNRLPQVDRSSVERPAIVPPASAGELSLAWHRGLELSYRHFTALGDPRLGAVRPIELLEDHDAVVMEFVEGPTLRQRILADRRNFGRRSDLDTMAEHAGMWLREYHAAGRSMDLPPRCPTRTDYLEAVTAFSTYLAGLTGQEEFFRRLRRGLERAADHVPESIALELAHGDYAPRNIFVGPDARVTAFDAAPRFRGPAAEDVARFLIAVRVSGLQTLTLGRAYATGRLDRFETRFLGGYYRSDSPPLGELRAFELLVLLNKFSAVLSRGSSLSLRVRTRAWIRGRFQFRGFRAEVDRILRSLD